MLKLRAYQKNIINEIRSRLRQGHKRIVACAPTGSGKTVIFSYIVKSSSENGYKCLIISNRTELLEQTGGTFEKIGIMYENLTAGTRSVPGSMITVAMVETLKRRLKSRLDFQMWVKTINLIIIDEAHLNCFNDIFNYANEGTIILGFTATPIRFGKMPELADSFTNLVVGTDIQNLIVDNFLSPAKYYGVPIDISTARIKAGEFDEGDLQKIYTSSEVFGGLKDNLQRHGHERKTIIFCPTVETSKQVAYELGCLHIDSEMSINDRHRTLDAFHNDPSGIISNVGILTTGYDHPPVSRIVLYRATKSLPLYLQICGRGSRIYPGKEDFMILDFGNNIIRHDFWHSKRKWSLENDKRKKRKSDKEGVFPIKDCPSCGALIAVNTMICPECGHIWTKTEQEKRMVELQEMEFGKITKMIASGMSVAEMEEIRIARGYKIGFLLHRFESFEQFKEYGDLKGYNKKWAYFQARKFKII